MPSWKNSVGKILEILCENAPLSIANTKTLLEEYVKSSGAPDAGRMRAAIERCTKSEDYKEGRRAFMEKRKPRFEGNEAEDREHPRPAVAAPMKRPLATSTGALTAAALLLIDWRPTAASSGARICSASASTTCRRSPSWSRRWPRC